MCFNTRDIYKDLIFISQPMKYEFLSDTEWKHEQYTYWFWSWEQKEKRL